ncbi:MAG: GH32 C-terminal domain-containing protein [Clostridia bacterium]|nr:GH32 C-terminal domain-containing protein [Clostridia bacterium]
MKKSFKAIALLSMAAVLTCACATGCSAQKKNSVEQDGKTVFPISSTDDSASYSMGDVMPFYDGEVMNIYHLQNSKGSLSMFYHPISRLTTSDFVNYTDCGISIDFVEDTKSVDASIGTGSVIKDNNGTYHFFYTGHNDNGTDKDIGLPHKECVRHATSPDQETWTKVEDFKLYGNSDDFRDPYLYYDADENLYNMLVTTRIGGGVIKRYSAASLNAQSSEWQDRGVFFYNDDGSYNMECPSYIEYNGVYYLAYSEQGDNRVTHYRYKTEKDGDWKKFERDSIDASGFYAGRLEKAGDKLYAFAWCANLTGGSTGDFDWGGNLVVHELKQLSSGELCAVMVSDVKNAFSSQVQYEFIDGGKIESAAFDGNFAAKCAEKLATNVTRISFTFSVGNYGGDFGMTFGLEGKYNNRLGTCAVAFDTAGSKLACYNDISSRVRYGNPLASVAFAYAAGRAYDVDIIIDSEILTVYLDGTVCLTARFPDMRRKNFAFYSNGVEVNIEGITFYE